MIILDIPIESWIIRVRKTKFKYLIDLTYIILIIDICCIFLGKVFGIYFFSIFLLCLILLLLRTINFSTYIYHIEKIENLLHIKYYKFRKSKILLIDINNFKINYYRNPKGTPIFLFEQLKPYKFLIYQGCYGYWTETTSIEIFRPYAKEIKFNP